MAQKVSRRIIAKVVAEKIVSGDKNVLLELAAYLVDTGRKKEVDLIAKDIFYQLEQNGVLYAKVDSAEKLSALMISQIEEHLKTKTGADKVRLKQNVDQELIGGIKITTPDAMQDSTVKGRIKALRALKK